jgi:Ca-activated chloride channel family protein
VIVTDNHDKFVTGLGEHDFAVFEDGIQQNLSFFAATDVPLDLAILLDLSSSMNDKLMTVQEAAVGFASHLRSEDRVTVVGVKDSARVLHGLDGDVAGASDAIRRTTASGGTALYNGLYTTIKQMQKVHAENGDIRRQAIAVLTDGDDTTSILSFDDVMALAKQAGIAIYTITLKSQYPSPLLSAIRGSSESEFAMKALAQETGARSFFPDRYLTARRRLQFDYEGTRQPIRARLHLEQSAARRQLPPASSSRSMSRTCARGRARVFRSRRRSSR